MTKIIFCNLDLLRIRFNDEEYSNYNFSWFDEKSIVKTRDVFVELIKYLIGIGNKVVFYSRSNKKLELAQNKYKENKELVFINRNVLFKAIHENKYISNLVVFVGIKEVDFTMAVKAKSLYIVPHWLPLSLKAMQYGVHVTSPRQFYELIMALNNQNFWYSQVRIDEKSEAYSLMDARYGYYAINEDEREIILNFQRLLKSGDSYSYRSALFAHFIAGMTNIALFDDIELYGCIPSSSGELNPFVYEFMTQIRCINGKRLPHNYSDEVPKELKNILIRHTRKQQNHNGGRGSLQRKELGAVDEFRTLMVNPDYRKRIDKLRQQGRLNICIFDDYMTHGNSFNAVRNIFNYLGANKIIFVSIGRFAQPFQRKDYKIEGDVYSSNYSYELINSFELHDFIINEQAKLEVANLHNIFRFAT